MRLRTTGIVASTGLALVSSTMTGLLAPASSHAPAASPQAPARAAVTTVAQGLDSPRHLSFADGKLYVAEAGRGGTGPCVTSAEGGTNCFGTTGAVTRITLPPAGKSKAKATTKRVLKGLPSVAEVDGSGASGPTDIIVDGQKWTLSIGLGNSPTARASLGQPAARLGTLTTGTFAHRTTKKVRTKSKPARWTKRTVSVPATGPKRLVDLTAFEGANDPDGAGADSNPGGLVARGRSIFAVDAGGNTLLKVTRRAATKKPATKAKVTTSVVRTFTTRTATTPPAMGGREVPMQSVPTSVTLGPDGALYVSELTGFPFPQGQSRILRVVAGRAPTVYATGLTNVTDLAFRGTTLYAVQLTDQGMLSGTESAPALGSLVKVNRTGAPTTVLGGLTMPYGVAISGQAAYVSVCAVCPGGGQVLKVPLGR